MLRDASGWIGPIATGVVGLLVGATLASGSGSTTTHTVTAPARTVTATATTQAAAAVQPSDNAIDVEQSDSTSPKIKGTLSRECGLIGGCTSPDAAAELDARDVWCRWNGDHIAVHAVLTNGMNARVTLSIVPKYFIEKGGQHGTSLGSDIELHLQPHQTQSWTGDAGRPEGVPTGTPISACEPHLQNIDIG